MLETVELIFKLYSTFIITFDLDNVCTAHPENTLIWIRKETLKNPYNDRST